MARKSRTLLLVILGSTATGKTNLAIFLAKKFNGELVSCDSRQVYRGLDIGTGKMPNQLTIDNGQLTKGKRYWEIDGIKIWMYDVVGPKRQYTVADYVKDAKKVIREIREIGKLPIVVGGTGLYLKALLEGLSNLAIPVDQKLRRKLEKLSKSELQKKLQEISPWKWNSLNKSDRENPRRLIRAIELTMQTQSRLPRHFVPRNDVLRIGLTAPREVLYKRVDEHVLNRIKQGMINEAEELQSHGLSFKRMRQLGLEYGILADYLDKKIKSKEDLIRIMQNKIHGYARRQLTWFKKESNVKWFNIKGKNFPARLEKMITKWYHQA